MAETAAKTAAAVVADLEVAGLVLEYVLLLTLVDADEDDDELRIEEFSGAKAEVFS